MTVIPLGRKRLRFSIEEGFDDGTRMAVAAIEMDPREVFKLLGYLDDVTKR